jgi:hypothetical protein
LSEEAASYESKDEALSSDKTFVTFWLDAIEAASSEEKDWRKEADESVEIYRSDCDEGQAEFNILYSNIETLLPAIYNSTPSPDVRRRFGDRDPIAKSVSDIIERAISYSVDAYDFDAMMQAVYSTRHCRGVAWQGCAMCPTSHRDQTRASRPKARPRKARKPKASRRNMLTGWTRLSRAKSSPMRKPSANTCRGSTFAGVRALCGTKCHGLPSNTS